MAKEASCLFSMEQTFRTYFLMYLVFTICSARKNFTKGLDELEINNPHQNNFACVDSRGSN